MLMLLSLKCKQRVRIQHANCSLGKALEPNTTNCLLKNTRGAMQKDSESVVFLADLPKIARLAWRKLGAVLSDKYGPGITYNELLAKTRKSAYRDYPICTKLLEELATKRATINELAAALDEVGMKATAKNIRIEYLYPKREVPELPKADVAVGDSVVILFGSHTGLIGTVLGVDEVFVKVHVEPGINTFPAKTDIAKVDKKL